MEVVKRLASFDINMRLLKMHFVFLIHLIKSVYHFLELSLLATQYAHQFKINVFRLNLYEPFSLMLF